MNSTLRKWAFLPIILVLAVGGGLLIRGNTGSQASEAGEQKAAEAPRSSEPAQVGEPAILDELNFKTIAERRQLLETIGVLTAAHCYQTYLNIGFIADGKTKGTYTDNEAYQFLDRIVSLLDAVDRKLAILGKIALNKEDRASLEQMRDLSDLLHRQARQLETFWDSGKDEDAARYDDARADAWAALSKFTGIGR